MQNLEIQLRGDHITLDAVLKLTGLAASGGGAKAMIAAGKVQVDGQQELRKTCKLRAGQVVSITGARVRILATNVSADGAEGNSDSEIARNAPPDDTK